MPTSPPAESYVFVTFASDQKTHKFKMMLKGDVGTLAVPKIKRYLQKATGVPESVQVLRFRGRDLTDELIGSDFGLHSGDELSLHVTEEPKPQPMSHQRAPSPPQLYVESAEILRLREECASLRQQLSTALRALDNPLRGASLAEESLVELSSVVPGAAPLRFDERQTCSVVVRGCTVLITYDAATQRLYIYSTLLNTLPRDPAQKIPLYEMLLEGALLGRDIVGGAVGISLKNDSVLLSTMVDLNHADKTALCDVVPQFVECLLKWRSQLKYVMQ